MKSFLLALFVSVGFLNAHTQAGDSTTTGTKAVMLANLQLGPEWGSKRLLVNEGELACYQRPGKGATLLLIPGTFSDRRVFTLAARHLDPELNLVIIENRGLGGSGTPPETSSIERCAVDALAVMDALKIDQFYAAGHSLGGMISIELGRQKPERVRGIISIEGWTNAGVAAKAFQSDMKSTLSPAQLESQAAYRQEVLKHWSKDQIQMFGNIWRQWDGSSFLESTKLPILELYGDRGRQRPARSALGLPEKDSIQLNWFSGASHSLLIERPVGVANAINAFIAANETSDINADVVVLGGTPGGIAAALTAARRGRSVVLVESQRHLGGMMASGLGKSDIENKEMIGGVFLEYTNRIYERYIKTYGSDHENVKLCQNGYYYEPSVAEQTLEAMLSETPGIKVLKDWRLTGTTLTGQQVVGITIQSRPLNQVKQLTAKVFIDATYEGDLYAAAGAGFRSGREARDEFQEPHAGVVYFDYDAQQFLPGTTGAGDDRLPAYTFRLCLTTDTQNATPMTAPPSGYDRTHYLGYLDDLQAGRLDAPKSYKPGRGYYPAHFGTLVRALSVTPLPNHKTDVNINPRPLGFPFAEMNIGYLEADEATRQQIHQRHREMALGLIWFLQNDEQVPEPHRQLARELAFPKDEFIDNGHFPFQLYVREGRRLRGLYTLTEHDVTGLDDTGAKDQKEILHQPDSIAVGEFPIDSFPCRKRQSGDTKVLEGYLGMLDHITRPYEIPYRIMVPEKLDGVIVPVAASTTHVAYSSIRMEPTWMALGQAAGTAADLAIQHQVAPRAIPVAELQQSLLQQGQVIRHQQASQAPPMLSGAWVPTDPRTIDFAKVPRIASEHSIVSDVRAAVSDPTKVEKTQGGVNQHNYLIFHQDQFWIMWSDGPGVEDRVGQRVKFATSRDGLTWSKAEFLTPEPPDSGPGTEFYGTRTDKGFRWIARGFWKRGEELFALASLDEAAGFFGPSLTLRAFRLDEQAHTWKDEGVILDNCINNFPPELLPNGQWMMSRRAYDYKKSGVHFVVGGTESIRSWESFPVLGSSSELAAEEPLWWVLPDNRLLAIFRDNRRSGFVYRSFSSDNGRTWSTPEQTNFPDATSKLHGLRLRDGRYVLVSNTNPKKRDPLTIAISQDGITFTQLGYLIGERHIDYPHVMEHEGCLYVAFAGGKQTVEVLRVRIDEMTRALGRTQPPNK